VGEIAGSSCLYVKTNRVLAVTNGVMVFSGGEAEFKAAMSLRVLHSATHGFFLSDQEFRRTNALRDSWIGNSGTRWNASLPKDDWENPLVRCGIALAGANNATKSPLRT
jgi:hypothetical protein